MSEEAKSGDVAQESQSPVSQSQPGLPRRQTSVFTGGATVAGGQATGEGKPPRASPAGIYPFIEVRHSCGGIFVRNHKRYATCNVCGAQIGIGPDYDRGV